MKVRVAHVSLQHGDSPKKHTEDIEKIFARAKARRVAWVTGTEAGPGSNNTAEELVRIGSKYGYRMFVPSTGEGEGRASDCWIGVREDLITKSWKTDFRPAIPGSQALYEEQGVKPDSFPRWGPRGLVTVSFDSAKLGGRVNIGAAHYLKDGRDPEDSTEKKVDHWEWNGKLAKVIATWAREVGRGKALAFYAGDQNMADSKNDQPQGDTFRGGPLTSLADELKKWQNTGHGPIDVIASYNKDSRVSGLDFEVFNDARLFLNTDHFYCEGLFDVQPGK